MVFYAGGRGKSICGSLSPCGMIRGLYIACTDQNVMEVVAARALERTHMNVTCRLDDNV